MSASNAIVAEIDRPPKLLLLDDDEVALVLTAAALREQGFEIADCNDSAKALELLLHWIPDGVVVDALMPTMDGFEVCRRLRARPGFETVPILMLTALDDEASIAHAYEAGATDFFIKGPQWSLLAGRLRYLLRSARMHQELERNRAKLARAQDLARMGSFDWHRGGGFVLSGEVLRVFGHGAHEQLTLRALLRYIETHERKGFLTIVRDALLQRSPLAIDVPMTLPDGRQRIVHVEAEPEFNEQGAAIGYTGIAQDVTDRRAAEDRIRHLANYDTLTGLPNRRQLIWRSERALEHARRLGHQVALLLIDLDRFKIVNDTLGHAAGDELLIEVSQRLRSCVRHSDQVVESALEAIGSRSHRTLEAIGRLGGDEFVALLPEVHDEADAEHIAQRILDVMREPIYVGSQECFVTASVGIALYPRDGASVADLMRNSDVAMYSVKSQGRNALSVFRAHLAGRGRDKLELESALHKAIERDELILHYQPKVDVRATRLIGAEALMRWRRGDRLVPPAEFIPLAEETGLIVPMSEWAVREAARQAKLWQLSFGFTESVAVNLPNLLFERTDLVEQIHAAVATYGVPHRSIQLEITETGLMRDLQNVIPSLHRLNEIGVEISIDDFGTGYSSLAYLTTLPISEVKIDRSFVRDLGITPQSSAVISAIIALARSLHLRVIAEGVETMRQMEVLYRLGCTTMQGYLFSKPLPADEIEAWVTRVLVARRAEWIGRTGEGEGSESLRLAGRGS